MGNVKNRRSSDISYRNDGRGSPVLSHRVCCDVVDSIRIMVGRWTNERLAIAVVIVGCGIASVRMILRVFVVVRRLVVAVSANMKMRSRSVAFRLRDSGPVVRVRKAQALVGQHQSNEQ